jgi:hypothetical protein
VMSCPGGQCHLTCSGADTCKIVDCEVGCVLTCGGAPVCESSCTPLDGGCATIP